MTEEKGFRLLQGNPDGKIGWWICKCGICGSYSDKDITKSHLNGKGCAESRRFFGLKKNEVFPHSKIKRSENDKRN